MIPSLKYGKEMVIIEESKNIGSAVLYWNDSHFYFCHCQQLIVCIFIRFTSLQESSVQFIITAISFISIFMGGFISGGKGKQKGWMLGGLTGFLYSVTHFFLPIPRS